MSALHIFATDRDATETEKGFEYQRLRTLDEWLYNKVHKIEEVIYYDYGDDIFANSTKLKQASFRQLKLYSSKNFSFASDEIQKAIAHFFMLFMEQNELKNEVSFVFETNTSVANPRGDNDARLLDDWIANQQALSPELLANCVAKCKEIVTAYIEARYKKLIEKEETKQEAEDSKEVYKKITDGLWEKFAKSITWDFKKVSANEALDACINSVKDLIAELPFPIASDERDIVFYRLYGEVGAKAVGDKAADRMLTNEQMERLLLTLGSDEDKSYSTTYENWQGYIVQVFTVAEFYEALSAAKYSRRQSYLHEHTDFWANILGQFLKIEDCSRSLKREAMYEIVWLRYKPTIDRAKEADMHGCEYFIREYFSDFEKYDNSRHVEDALNLLSIVLTAQKTRKVDLTEEEVELWLKRFLKMIEEKLAAAVEPNERCRLIELRGFFFFHLITWRIAEGSFRDIIEIFRKILPLLPSAPLYSVSQLNKNIDAFSGLLVQLTTGYEEDIQAFEGFQDELSEIIATREVGYSKGKAYVDRGYTYLKKGNESSFVLALNYFHKAKDAWYQDELIGGYTLALANISQLYAALGFNFAAKYYALGTAWVPLKGNVSPEVYKRIADSSGLLFYADYKQGSWISALYYFDTYLNAKLTFDPKKLDDDGELWNNALLELAIILYYSPKVSPQLQTFINSYKTRMNAFYTDYVKDMVDAIDDEKVKELMDKVSKMKVDDRILNDVGKTRTVSWLWAGIRWEISFPNDFIGNSIGEEFCALFQVFQLELTSRAIALRLSTEPVSITITIGVTVSATPQSDKGLAWDVVLRRIEENDRGTIAVLHHEVTKGIRSIIGKRSSLSHDEIQQVWMAMYTDKGFMTKLISVTAYQRMYRGVFKVEDFKDSQRDRFESIS